MPGSWHLNEQPSSLLNYTNSCNQDATAKYSKITKQLIKKCFFNTKITTKKGCQRLKRGRESVHSPQKYEVEMPMTNDATTTERN